MPAAMKIKSPHRKTLLIWGVPEEMKQKFKAQCAKNGVPMRQVIMDFLKRYTGGNNA